MKRKPRLNGKFLTLREAEREYGFTYHMLYGWVLEGRLPRLGGIGRSYLIKRSDLDAFIDANMTTGRADD